MSPARLRPPATGRSGICHADRYGCVIAMVGSYRQNAARAGRERHVGMDEDGQAEGRRLANGQHAEIAEHPVRIAVHPQRLQSPPDCRSAYGRDQQCGGDSAGPIGPYGDRQGARAQPRRPMGVSVTGAAVMAKEATSGSPAKLVGPATWANPRGVQA